MTEGWGGPCWAGRRLFLVLGTAFLADGCIDTDATIFVDATIIDPHATTGDELLGTSLDGGFGLELHLGPRAADASEVKLGAFSIVDAGRTVTIVPSLSLTTAPAFPLVVAVDSTVAATMSFSTGASLLPDAAYADLCAAGGVVISGSIDDSLLAATAVVASEPFHPSGCP